MDGTDGYWLTRLLLQRGLGCIYLVAFLVVVNQFRPLCGEKGLLPASRFMQFTTFSEAPSIFFLCPKDSAFAFFGWCGVLLAGLAVTGLSEGFGSVISTAVWLLLWVLYLSFVNIGQTFYAFGWESLLLESGFLAIFLGAANIEPTAIMIWLFRWVLFRVILGAGLIKLRGDPCWHDLSCLDYHFETQPMPNPLSWYFHRLPGWVHRGGVFFNHLVEVVVPFFFFAPQPLAAGAGMLTILFQGTLIVSGNFSWLNFLTLVLAFSTFNDAQLGRVLPFTMPPLSPLSPFHAGVIWCVTLLVAFLSIKPLRNLFASHQVMNNCYDRLHMVNTYGAFGSITRKRFEIVIEGTEETVVLPTTRWKAYEFKGKPGGVTRLPPQFAPYHLRLDWLMWFAAMPSRYYDTWFIQLLAKLLDNDASTLTLLKYNPFPADPPRHVRALYYRYRFTTPEERKLGEGWWHRKRIGIYFPPVSQHDPAFRAMLETSGL
jgi:hypothetical protein